MEQTAINSEFSMMLEMVKKLAQDKIAPRAAEVDRTDEFPHDLVKVIGDAGLLTLSLPEEYGGIGANCSMLSMVIEELSKACTVMGPIMLSTHSVIRIVSAYATEAQLNAFYRNLQSGHHLCAFCLTEPQAGSDARALSTTAEKVGTRYRINGEKRFITLAQVAEWYLVYAKTKPDEISSFLIHKDTPGLKFGRVEEKMGLNGSMTGDVIFDDCWVDESMRIGPEGSGWTQLATHGNSMRAWGAGSIALGIAQAALEHAVNYAKERRQFGKSIGDFQAIRFMLADCAMQLEAARSLVREANRVVDTEAPHVSPKGMAMVSMAKCFATDTAMKVTTDAVQVFGGYGYTKDYPVERLMRDAKVFQILDGSNQVQRMIVGSYLMKHLGER